MRLAAQFIMLCTAGVPGFAGTPNTVDLIDGSKTVEGFRLGPDARAILRDGSASGEVLVRLPAVKRSAAPSLLGMLPDRANIEVFLSYVDEMTGSDPKQIVEVWRGRRGGEAALVHSFALEAGGFSRVSFFQPPDGRDTPKVLIDVLAGSWAYRTYLLAPDRRSIKELFVATTYEFRDLDGDGVYELIEWIRGQRSGRGRCGPSLVPGEPYPVILVRNGPGYRQVWPSADWTGRPGANYQMEGTIEDLGGDGGAELVVLKDVGGDAPQQSLAVYRYENKAFHLAAEKPLPPERIAYVLEVRDGADGKEIMVRSGSPPPCGKASHDEDTVYRLRGDELLVPERE